MGDPTVKNIHIINFGKMNLIKKVPDLIKSSLKEREITGRFSKINLKMGVTLSL